MSTRTGAPPNETITGTQGRDTLVLDGPLDAVDAAGGNDDVRLVLTRQVPDDITTPELGALYPDRLDGGAGDDTLTLSGAVSLPSSNFDRNVLRYSNGVLRVDYLVSASRGGEIFETVPIQTEGFETLVLETQGSVFAEFFSFGFDTLVVAQEDGQIDLRLDRLERLPVLDLTRLSITGDTNPGLTRAEFEQEVRVLTSNTESTTHAQVFDLGRVPRFFPDLRMVVQDAQMVRLVDGTFSAFDLLPRTIRLTPNNDTVVNTQSTASGQIYLRLREGDDSATLGNHRLGLVMAGPGNDTVSIVGELSNSAYRVFGGEGDDVLRGGVAGDNLYGEAGDDLIIGGAFQDQLFGGDGDDTIFGFDDMDGVDTRWENEFEFQGRDEDIGISFGIDRMFGGAGNDLITGSSGADLALGGADADTIFGRARNDRLFGEDGDDDLHGELGNDTLWGGAGDDALYGGIGFDRIFGGDGSDTVWGGDGQDLVFLEAGNDLFIDNAQGGAFGADLVLAGEGHDTIQGGNGNDTFYGGAGDDEIVARLGNDKVYGGLGDDLVWLNQGADTFYGSSTLFNPRLTITQAQLDAGSAGGDAGNDTIWAGFGDDLVLAGDGDDVIYAEWGRDTIYAFGGDDTVYVHAEGNSSPEGGRGVNNVYLGDGNDTFFGRADPGIVWGGTGADRFVFVSDAFSHEIGDFEVGVDTLVLRRDIFPDPDAEDFLAVVASFFDVFAAGVGFEKIDAEADAALMFLGVFDLEGIVNSIEFV